MKNAMGLQPIRRLLFALALLAFVNAAAAEMAGSMPLFAVAPSAPIECSGSPFGQQVTVGLDTEIINMMAGGNFNLFDVYQPGAPSPADPLLQENRFGFIGDVLAGTVLLHAVTVDLNGDGRDEIVTAHRDSVRGMLILAVFGRGGDGALTRIGEWERAESFIDAELVAGDFDGSGDGKQEVGVVIHRASSEGDRVTVYLFTGNADADIAQVDADWAGFWSRNEPANNVAVAVGDLLLNGRDQLVLVTETGSGKARAVNYHLLEFQPQSVALPIIHGNEEIGSAHFVSIMGTSFRVGTSDEFGVDDVVGMQASAGDVVDTAAAELVVHFQMRLGDQYFIGQRLHHFNTERDDDEITGISFASQGPGREFDSSRLVQNLSFDPPGRFQSTIADINRRSPNEVVLARADGNRFIVEAYRAKVELEAAYSWERSGLAVRFRDQSAGDALAYEWDFGDASGPIFDRNPVKLFAAPGTYPVRLRVDGPQGNSDEFVLQITVAATGSGSGGAVAEYRYRLIDAPLHSAEYVADSSSALSFIRLAVGDIDKDGIGDIVTTGRYNSGSMLRSVWTLGDPQAPGVLTARHQIEDLPMFFNTTNAVVLLGADFDGDSTHARLGTDCRRVQEPQVRQVMWQPPYFEALQQDAGKLASFGESTSGGSGLEQRSGSFTSHSFSAHVGASVGSELLGVEASVTTTAGYSYQVARGELRGSSNSFQIDQSFSQSTGEALVVLEENAFDCYGYDFHSESLGWLSDSAGRLCEVVEGSRFVSATDARFWDTQLAGSNGGSPPAQWMPLQRDWASLTLFRPVMSNAGVTAGGSPQHATDGLFNTRATTSISGLNPPLVYIEVDLQSVQDISSIRVLPGSDLPGNLAGARLYVSETPFTSGDEPPSGPGVSVFAPEPADGPYATWTAWTRSATAPHAMLKGRYLRVHRVTPGRLSIAQIQAFGDVHAEPPRYPDAVCDPTRWDNRHSARVWDGVSSVSGGFRNIHARGDMLWNGTGSMPGCTNFSGLPQTPIWANTVVGSSASVSWNLSQESSDLIGETTSFESAVRAGAEFDLQAGFIGTVNGGGGYEYTGGVTEDAQTTSYWGSGLEMGGGVGGFDNQDATLINSCRYNPRPYAYRLLDVSNTGYQHEIYAVDYVVRQATGLWQRGSVPVRCLNLAPPIFRSGFE